MESIRRHLLLWCLLSLVLLAPLAAPVGAAGDAATDGDSTTDRIPAADANRTSGHEFENRELPVTDAARNVTNASTGVLANGTNGSLSAVETNGSNPTDPASEAVDGLDDASALDGSSSGIDLPGPETDRSLAVLGPELARFAVPLALDGSPHLSSGDDSEPAVEEAAPSPSSAAADEPDDGSTATVTPTPDAVNGSADAGDGGPGGESPASGDGLDVDAGASVAFVPPLGAALFVVATRPWLGLLAAAAGAAVDWFANAFVLLRYGRHDGSDPLAHETRARIHDRVAESPGRTLTELSKALETPLSTVRHHVRILERERVVVSRKLRGNRRIYPLGAENAELAAALDEESSAAVLAVLHEQGRATVGEVVDRVEKSYSTVSYHLSRLADEGLVVQEREGRQTLSRLDPDVESLLDAPDDPAPAAPERSGREASAD